MTDRFRPDAALRGITPPVDRGLGSKRLGEIIRENAVATAIVALGDRAADALFEDRGPIGHKGRNSIPRSHRGEGFNFVD